MSVNVWAPVVNPLRHPLWGRNEEGFSEDPHLTAALAGAYCAGLKGNHERFWLTVPTLKHFLAYNNETTATSPAASYGRVCSMSTSCRPIAVPSRTAWQVP